MSISLEVGIPFTSSYNFTVYDIRYQTSPHVTICTCFIVHSHNECTQVISNLEVAHDAHLTTTQCQDFPDYHVLSFHFRSPLTIRVLPVYSENTHNDQPPLYSQ